MAIGQLDGHTPKNLNITTRTPNSLTCRQVPSEFLLLLDKPTYMYINNITRKCWL